MANKEEMFESAILLPSDSDPEAEAASSPPWIKKRAATIGAVVGLALLGALVYASLITPSNAFLQKASVTDSIQLNAAGNTFYIIKHTFNHKEDAADWWEKMKPLQSDKKAQGKWLQAVHAKGFHNAYFFPTAEAGPFYCIWEAREDKTEADMVDFIDNDEASPAKKSFGIHNEVMSINTQLEGGTPAKDDFKEKDERRLDAVKGSTFYIIEHTFADKEEAPTKWWAHASELMHAPKKYAAMVKDFTDQGFYNALFMPTAKAGPFFCIWEAKEGKTQADMEKFINTYPTSPAGEKSGLVNKVMPIPTALTGGPPMPPHFK